MKLRSIILVSIISLASSCHLLAQTAGDQIQRLMPSPLLPSPNVASLEKFGDCEVSYFHGLPEISIPIFEVKSGELSIPITLSYHASGVKYGQVASWVGQNWALSTGGQIQRSVRGQADEIGYYSSTSGALVDGSMNFCYDWNFLRDAANGANDLEPDVFSYSYPGKNGRFLLGKQGSTPPYLIPFEPIIVKVPNPQPVTIFDKFEITDENGILYRFGKNSLNKAAVEGAGCVSNGVPSSAKGSWMLMEMISPNSDNQISINYNSFIGSSTSYDVNSMVQIKDYCVGLLPPGASCPDNIAQTTSSSVQSTTDQQFVETIVYKFGKVEFILGPIRADESNLKSLDKINIYSLANGQYTLQKAVKFVYSYFGTDTSLKLDAIQFLDNQNKIINQYTFGYTTNSFSWNGNMYARDYWGFYNGMPNNDLIPFVQIAVYPSAATNSYSYADVGSANRNTNPQFLLEGTLNSVSYPTGGYMQMDFEPHKFSYGGKTYTGGGIRVAKITSSANDGSPAVVKVYKYGKNESGIGDANFSPFANVISSEFTFHDKKCTDIGGPVYDYSYRIRSYFSRSTFNSDGFESATVNYPYVTEYIGDPSGATLGKNVYEFDNGASTQNGVTIMAPKLSKAWFDSYSWRHGFLTRKATYDRNNKLVSERLISYNNFKAQDKFIGYGVGFTGIPVPCPTNGCVDKFNNTVDGGIFSVAYLTQSTGAIREGLVKEYSYQQDNSGQFILSQMDRTYEQQNLLLTSSTLSVGDGPDQLVTSHQYPFQLPATGSSTGNALGIQMLNAKNILTTPIETITYRKNSDGSNARIISGQVTTYRQHDTNPSYVVPDQIHSWESATPTPKSSYVSAAINSSNNGILLDTRYKARISMLTYDAAGNIEEVKKTDDQPKTYVWGYNNSFPIAEITNASLKNVFYTSFEEDVSGVLPEGKTGNQSSSIGIKKNLTNLDPGNYILSYFKKQSTGWIPVVSIVPVTANGLSDIIIGGQIDEVRFYPVDARMTTYTYNSILGITSTTDHNGITTYYKYDAFGRTIGVKDNDQNLLKSFKYNYAKP